MSTKSLEHTSAADIRALGVDVRLVVTLAGALDPALSILREDLAALDLACSRFRPDSELSQLNTADGRRTHISPLFANAIDIALQAARRTEGDVDPTLGASLIRLGYDRDFDDLPERGDAVDIQIRRISHWSEIDLDLEGGTVQLPPGVQLDLGATAKALGADLAAVHIERRLSTGVLVSLGGDVACAGAGPAGDWAVRVQDRSTPMGMIPDGPHATVAITGGGLATSSTSARRWQRGGDVMHHLLDPRTGMSVDSPWRTVSVHAASCVDANVASTAAIVRGRRALTWLRSLGLPARLVDQAGEVQFVNAWPTDHDS
jgi:thiamine biosynthesis lipoprotein